MQVIDYLAKHSLYSPDKVSLIEVSTGRRFTYREINDHANQTANFFEALGITTGDRVALLSSNCAQIIEILFGLTKLGAIFLPLNFRRQHPSSCRSWRKPSRRR